MNSESDAKSFVGMHDIEVVFPQTYGTIHALTKLTLSVKKHEIVCIVGPSGSGKSTILRLIAGLLEPTNGKVVVSDNHPAEYLKNQGIGFSFQRTVVFPWRTVLENVLLPMELRHKIDKADISAARELLKELDLAGFEDAAPDQLSGGMLQRVSLARSLMASQELLLLDEPYGSLDAMTRERLWHEFRDVWRERKLTVILVTHDVTEAVYLGDRIYVLSPRPGTIEDEPIHVTLPADRDLQLLDDAEFRSICRDLRARLIYQ